MAQLQQQSLNSRAAEALRRRAAPRSNLLSPKPEDAHRPFPLSDMQQAYWIGRSGDIQGGGVAMQSYLEIDCPGLDQDRLQNALNALVVRHPMLRAVASPDGMQQVLPPPQCFPLHLDRLESLSPDGQREALEATAQRMCRTVSDLETWPQSEVRFSQLEKMPDGLRRGLLHFRWDMWAMDGRSFQILFEDLVALYLDPEAKLPTLPVTFRDYILDLRSAEETPAFREILRHWQERLPKLPPAPAFPLPPEDGDHPEQGIKRYEAVLSEQETAAIKETCARQGISLTALLAAVYGEVIAYWSNSESFTLNIPRFNRPLDRHPSFDHVIGEFATFTLAEVNSAEGADIVEKAKNMQRSLWSSLEHGLISGVRLLRELARQRGTLEAEIMPVVFTAMPDPRSGNDGLEKILSAFGPVRRTHGSTPQTKLDCQYSVFMNRLHLYWDGRVNSFPPGMTDEMFAEYIRILRLLGADPEAWSRPNLLRLPEEQAARRAGRNNRPLALPEGTVWELILEKAEADPQAPALIAPDHCLNYAETLSLARLAAGRIRRALDSRPAKGRETAMAPIALALRRGWRAIIGLLGAHLAGHPYLPLDPDCPPPRMEAQLKTGGALLLLAEGDLLSVAQKAGIPAISIDAALEAEEGGGGPDSVAVPHSALPASDSAAYVMLTSGTTGRPKAVVVGHRGLLNAVLYSNERFGLEPDDRLVGVTALHHDLSLYDIFGALTSGAALVLLPSDGVLRPEVWLKTILSHRVSFWNSVPAFLDELLRLAEEKRSALPIRTFVCGGDWVSPALPVRARAASPGCAFYSVGGPTETTIWNIMYDAATRPDGWTSVPYGAPIPNNAYHLLDKRMREVPDWVSGEMYCSGLGVCLDIISDAPQAPFSAHPETGQRLYRTGDVGRYHDDGLIEILGRTDFQLNIGGYRLDPAEIENALAINPLVRVSVVLPVPSPGGEVLGVCIETATGDIPLEEAKMELGEWLQDRLPLFMLPKIWHFVSELPLTANGKIDRKSLLTQAASLAGLPDESGGSSGGRVPATPLEHLLADLWGEVLDLKIADVTQNFFHLGGDSLKAMRILTRLKERLPFSVPLSLFFTAPTIESLAAQFLSGISVRLAGKTSNPE
jgi:amino acid adenylation domain-containing protein